jgi:hypothetical protein
MRLVDLARRDSPLSQRLRHKLELVLILPDDGPQTIHDAHLPQPRHIAHANGDLRELVQVLEHIRQREPARSTLTTKEAAIVSANP